MAKKENLFFFIFILYWYSISTMSNLVSKSLLSKFPYPMTTTMVQLLQIGLLTDPLLKFFNMKQSKSDVHINWMVYLKTMVPLALGKFLGVVLNHLSTLKASVSYANIGNNFINALSSINPFDELIVFVNSKEFSTIVCSCIIKINLTRGTIWKSLFKFIANYHWCRNIVSFGVQL